MTKSKPIVEPTPVVVANEDPLVVISADKVVSSSKTVTKGEGTTLSPTTTEAEDVDSEGIRQASALTTERQSRINLIWELTQSIISVVIVGALIFCSINQIPTEDLSNAVFLIIGFYFSRTNHQAIGGIGPKPRQAPYQGR